MKIRCFITCFLCSICCFGQVIPTERLVDWSAAGLKNIPITTHITLNFVTEGGDNTGLISNDLVLQNVLEAYEGTAIVLFFPSGTYLFKQTIHLQNNTTLQGVSSDSTFFNFNLTDEGHLIRIEGTPSSDTTMVFNTISKDDDTINVFDANLFNVGDFIQIKPIDDALIYSDWAKQSTGQICQIESVNGSVLQLTSKIRRDYSATETPFIQKINPIMNVGIERINITRTNPTDTQSSHILLNYAHNCWAKCIQSYQCNFAHIAINKSSHIEISGSHFQEAFDYGGGGKAYGVVLQSTSSDCLIVNNTFKQLRHAMLLQSGANGNVLSYNYSQDPFWTGVSLPANSAGDLVLHGNYPYANLLEGNVVQNIVIDDSHAENGPLNTFFRNRAEGYGIFMNNAPPSNQQNFIGNEITNASFPYGLYFLQGENHFEYGNQTPTATIPKNTYDLNTPSLYLTEVPMFLQNQSFPPVGFPNELNEVLIPAQNRWSNNSLTACAIEDNINTTAIVETKNAIWAIHPNPANKVVFIKNLNASSTIHCIEVMDINGHILSMQQATTINIESFPKGVLFIKIHCSDGSIQIKKLLHV